VVVLILAAQKKFKLNSIKLKQGVCHTVALPFALKIYLKAKEEL
jgi:hypothetical protein